MSTATFRRCAYIAQLRGTSGPASDIIGLRRRADSVSHQLQPRCHPRFRAAQQGLKRLAAGLLLLLLAACGGAIDGEEARLCRLVVPALNEGAALALDPARRGPFPLSLRIDYGVTAPAGGSASRFVICRFSASRNAKGQRELVGLATELGPMADASFFFLRRFYLDVPGAALDPAPPALGEGVH